MRMGRLGMVMPAQRVAHLLSNSIASSDSSQELPTQIWNFRSYENEQFRVGGDGSGKASDSTNYAALIK